jgi:hypothetical protein
LVEHLQKEQEEQEEQEELKLITPEDVLCVKIAGLCHDLGKVEPLSYLMFCTIFLHESI